MNKTYLILDCNYLCCRTYYALKKNGDITTPFLIFSFFQFIAHLIEKWDTNKLVFCWDSKISKRKELYPEYKAGRRKDLDEEEQAQMQLLFQSMDTLKRLLPAFGWRNVYQTDGYEADDLIMSICQHALEGKEAVIITADNDLLQCLAPNIILNNPNQGKSVSLRDFVAKYGIRPEQWPFVKAIAGCSSDNVAGIPGVGEKTAIQYLTKTLSPTAQRYLKIEKEKEKLLKTNMPIVELPFEGTPVISRLREDRLSKEKWKRICKKYSISSISFSSFFSRFWHNERPSS